MRSRTGRIASDPATGDDELARVTTRAELGSLLTGLRARSGLSLRELAGRLHSSASTLSGWCRAENLPFPSQHDVFRRLLEELGVDDTEPWIDALIRVRDGATPRALDAPAPYRGLDSFSEHDAEWFFGRADLTARAFEVVRELAGRDDRPRLLVIVGASGSGKSSLVHAGLRPRLEAEGRECRSFAPGPQPLDRLAAALSPEPDHAALQATQDDPLAWVGTAADPAELDRLVIVVDQLEELFTECEDADQRDRVLAALETLADPTLSGCLVVTALRIDLYADLAATGRFAEALQAAQILVGPMDTRQLTQVIVEPARQAGWSVDDDLVAVLLRDFLPVGSVGGRHAPGALPMLSYALLETWRRSRRGWMTVADYHAAGGIAGAIEQAAEQAYADLTPAQQALARDVLLRLVRLSDDDTLATRRSASFHELEGLARLEPVDDPPSATADEPRIAHHRAEDVDRVVDRFVEARLLTAQENTIELTHEALLDAWPRLAGWIEQDRDALRVRRTIAEATRHWLDSGRDPSTLASGARLAAVRSWTGSASRPLLLSQVERSFIEASVDAADAAEAAARQRTRRLRALVAVASAFALLAGALALAASAARSDAIAARDDALSRQVALTSDRLRDTDPSLAAQLAVVGHAIAPTTEARSTLLDMAVAPHPARYLGGPGTTVSVLSADGGVAAVSDAADAAVQLFHADEDGLTRAARLDLDDPDAEIYAMALGPAERVLAVGDTTASITLWDIGDPDAPHRLAGPLHGPAGPIQGLAFDPAGTEVAAVGLGDGVFRWDVTDPTSPNPLPLLPSTEITWSVAYHPTGDIIAAGTDAGEVVLWGVGGEPALRAELEAGERPVVGLAFSPDGTALAAGSQDSDLRVWDTSELADPALVEVEESRFGSWVNTVAFSPDGAHLAAGSSDTFVGLWDTTSWERIQSLPHGAAVTDIVFGDAGATLLTTATDGTARSWALAASLPVRFHGAVWGLTGDRAGTRYAAFTGNEAVLWSLDPASGTTTIHDRLATPADGPAFSGGGTMDADGSLLALGTVSGEVWLARIDDDGRARLIEPPLESATGLIEELAFSPDGDVLVAAGRDTDVHVWDVTDPQDPSLLATVEAPTEIVLAIAHSPTAPLVAAGSADNHGYLIDLADPRDPQLLARLDGFDSDLYTAAFSPDGHTLALAGSDATVVLWDLSDPGDPQRIGTPISGPTGRVFSLRFDPDGGHLTAAVVDGTVWVWDISDPAQPDAVRMLDPQGGQAYAVHVAPDGRHLLASGAAGHLWVWPTDEGRAVQRICAGTGDPITDEEWANYLPDRPYEPPC